MPIQQRLMALIDLFSIINSIIMDIQKVKSEIKSQGYYLPLDEKIIYMHLSTHVEKIHGCFGRIAHDGIIQKSALIDIAQKTADLVAAFERHGIYF